MTDPRLAELVALAERAMRKAQVPGVAIGVIDGDRDELAFLGRTHAERADPVGPDTVFSIASITKTLVATALVALAERGRVDLDAPVRRYVPEFALADADHGARVTVRHLLVHTGGWIGEAAPSLDGPDALARVAASCASAPIVTEPGALFSYNNVGYAVAGRVLEVVTGLAFEDSLRDLVMRPLGLARTGFSAPPDADVAAEHTVREGRPAVVHGSIDHRSMRPAGGLRSSLRDLLRYARCQLGEGRQVLSPRAAASMWEKQVALEGPEEWKAISWFVDERQGVPFLHHGGATVTHMSLLAFAPQRGLGAVVLTNGANGTPLAWHVVRRWLELYAGARPPLAPAPIAVPADVLAEYAGRYEWPTSDIEIALKDGALELRLTWKGWVAERPPLPPFRLAFYRPDGVMPADGPYQAGDFRRNPAGAVRLFRWNLRARPRVA